MSNQDHLISEDPEFADIPKIEPNTEWGDWDGERIDTETRIRVLAAHPDGGWLIEEVNGDPGFEIKTEEDLRAHWRLLPVEMTPEKVIARLNEIHQAAGQNDYEVSEEKTQKLYVDVLRTIAIYPLSRAAQIELANTVLQGTEGD